MGTLRALPVRAYDAAALMVDADVVDGRELESVVEPLFDDDPRVQDLHVHFARPGCYACRIDRASKEAVVAKCQRISPGSSDSPPDAGDP